MNEPIDIPGDRTLSLPRKELAVLSSPPPVVEMLKAAIAGGITADNVVAVEKLVALYERMEERESERQFAAAFVALQAEMPVVQAVKPVHTKTGELKYKFAPFEDIMAVVKPLIQKHGFTLTFSMDFKEGRVIQNCTMQHVGGHSRTNVFMARVGSGPPGASDAQADGAASTYAKRFALCNALNIVCEVDTDGAKQDARDLGTPISKDQAQYLREQVKETGSDETAFLKFAHAATYEEIGTASYPQLVQMLEKKKAKR